MPVASVPERSRDLGMLDEGCLLATIAPLAQGKCFHGYRGVVFLMAISEEQCAVSTA